MVASKKIFPPVLAIISLTMLTLNVSAQGTGKLPRSTPEAEGVSSAGIIDFINAVDTGSVELHSFMFIRHGKVIAEGWWAPYRPDHKHLLYSASKTFTATGIGLAVSENRLRITDRVVSFFPYSMPEEPCEYINELTVENLLTMAVGQDPEPRSMGNNGDWVNTFLSTTPVYKPGTVFKYNNMATFMQSAIIQQVTGQTLFEYLKPRIFEPLGIHGIDWDMNPQGINLGMIGLRLRTEDLAKFGQLLLQGGMWDKKQLIPQAWVREATSFKIESSDPGNKTPKELNDWAQGYCYQMWRGCNNTVRLDGMGGQFVVLIPDKDAVVVLTANARNTQHELNLLHNYLIPAIRSVKPLPADTDKQNELVKRESSLSLKTTVSFSADPEIASKVCGREFMLEENDYRIQSLFFSFGDGGMSFTLKRENQLYSIKAGLDKWKVSGTPLTAVLAPAAGTPSKSVDANYTVPFSVAKVGASYAWTDDNTLELTARFVEESLGPQVIAFKFSEMGGVVRVTVEPKATGGMFPGFAPPQVRLRGTMIKID
jgi:CubicO group peptidase (beta-lactamase class C family)